MRVRLALLFSCLLTLIGCASGGKKLCDNIYMHEGELELWRNEEVLVCGTSRGPEAWRDVPIPQAQYQIGVLLQRQGYLYPRFERNKDQLQVWSGPRQSISALVVNGAEDLIDESRKRQIVGEPLTPARLDEVTRWVQQIVRSHGHACPEVKVQAQAWDGRVVVDVDPGPKQKIASIERTNLGGLAPGATYRFEAFDVGDPFDIRQTELTANRMMANGLFQSAYFTHRCRGEEVDLVLNTALGPPRLLSFSVGASTEEFPFTQIQLRNSKLDERASSYAATVKLSPREQSLTLGSELYWLPSFPRTFFGPRFRGERASEPTYESLSARSGVDLGRYWDYDHYRFRGRGGPTVNYVNTVRGVGPQDVYFLSWEGSLSVQTNDYELFFRDQYEGWSSAFEYIGQRKGIGSPINVDRLELDFTYLWNLGAYHPPFLVLGTRTEAVAVNANPTVLSTERNVLPPEYRIFYGGDRNLRGFGRQALHNEDLGYLTALYLGWELRLIEQLPYRLQPFVLFDVARLGNRRFTLDEPLFTSQGLGLRWGSPFGTLRGTAARGRILNEDVSTQKYPQEWVYFLSFGQEF